MEAKVFLLMLKYNPNSTQVEMLCKCNANNEKKNIIKLFANLMDTYFIHNRTEQTSGKSELFYHFLKNMNLFRT